MRRSIHLIALAALFACVGSVAVAQTPSYVYGIDDNNNIWEINPGAKTANNVLSTILSGTQNSNAFAYDRDRDHMFFMYSGLNGGDTNAAGLYYWNHQSGTSSVVQRVLDDASYIDIANAAYYNNAYWFFNENGNASQGSNVLFKLSLSYSGSGNGAVPTVSGTTSWTIANLAAGENINTFGDIAIDADDATLYANNVNGNFYKITDLNGTPTYDGSPIATGLGSLQNAFNENYDVLYGHSFTNKTWFTIDTLTGAKTEIAGFESLVGFRDLGGSSISAVPEPSTIVLGLGGVGLMAVRFLRRRNRRGGSAS